MNRLILKPFFILLLAVVVPVFNGCGGWWSRPTSSSSSIASIPPAKPIPSEDKAVESSIRWLEDRVKDNPGDFIAYNKLAGYYLRRLQETGSMNYLELASRAVEGSFAVLPKEENAGGLGVLAEIEYASHNFATSRDYAYKLIEMSKLTNFTRQQMSDLGPYQLLADSLLELGEYDKAKAAYKEMEKRNVYGPDALASVEIRLSRLAFLQGKMIAAETHLTNALSNALEAVPPPRERITWIRWQLGETAFAAGKYEAAEQHYRDALVTYPDYFRALASLGKVRAARGDLQQAIEYYEKTTKINPDPIFISALGDIYKLSGREQEAKAQYELVEQIAKLSKLRGALYNRQLAIFYADHDMKPEEAYQNAIKEYEARKDIYGADAVAWTALKAGKLKEAQEAMKEALKLDTQDAKLYYHAGMIAMAAGDSAGAKSNLDKALKLNPQFDPFQAQIARSALEKL
jgi:pentatricopeptide repeat protein